MKLLLLLSLSAFLATCTEGLRFGHNPVTVDTEALIVGKPAKLTCNFVKYRTENVREISWFLGYSTFNTKIFSYAVSTGVKEGSSFPWIQTDEASATDSELTVTLTSFREENVTVGCEVEVIRDNGYGKLRHSKKKGESVVRSVDTQSHQLYMKADPSLGMAATADKPVQVSCIIEGSNPPPQLSLVINGVNLGNVYTGSLREETSPDGNKLELIGRIEAVAPTLFKDGYLTVECLAHYDDYLFGKKEISLKQTENKYNVGNNANANSYSNSRYVRPGTNRRMWEDDSNSGTANEFGSSSSSPSVERGTGSRSRSGRVSSSMEDNVNRLLDMVDPARHVHPGIPYDFFAGYVVLVADKINPNADNNGDYVTLLGELPYDVEKALLRNYGRVNQLTHEKLRIKMEPVKVLNILANLGYRVVGQSDKGAQEYVWTLEKKNFDGASNGNGAHDHQGL